MQNTNMVISKTKILESTSGFACFCFQFRGVLSHHRLGLIGTIFADTLHLITNVFVYHLLAAQIGTKGHPPKREVFYVLRVSLNRNAKCQLKWCQQGGKKSKTAENNVLKSFEEVATASWEHGEPWPCKGVQSPLLRLQSGCLCSAASILRSCSSVIPAHILLFIC